MLGCGVEPGSEIITTPYTWGASVSAILAIGAVPVFADIDYSTGQLDPSSVAACITPRTCGILAVHLFGTPAPVDRLSALAARHGLLLIEDASQAHGARLHGQRVGTFGDASAFSCMGMKPFGATEGGFAVFKDPAARERAYLYGRHPRGMDPDRVASLNAEGLLDTLQLGWRPSAISAAILQARLPDLDAENAGRRANARQLREAMEDLHGLVLPDEPEGAEPVYHLLSMLVEGDDMPRQRDACIAALRQAGLPPFAYIPRPIHRMRRLNPHDYDGPPVLWHAWLRQAGVDYRLTRCPNAEKRSASALEFSWNFTEEEPASMKAIAEAIGEALQTFHQS